MWSGDNGFARRVRRLAAVAAGLVLLPAVVEGQVPDPPMGFFAVDLRGTLARLGPTPEQASAIGYVKAELPTRAWGTDVGAHVYPLRWNRVALGVGGNIVLATGESDPVDARGEPTGRTAQTRFRSYATQVSVNFGSQAGWSYLSAGIGASTFVISNEAVPEPASIPRRRTVNMGVGARWGLRSRLALSIDLRWYRMAAQEATETRAADPRSTRFVAGVGLAVR